MTDYKITKNEELKSNMKEFEELISLDTDISICSIEIKNKDPKMKEYIKEYVKQEKMNNIVMMLNNNRIPQIWIDYNDYNEIERVNFICSENKINDSGKKKFLEMLIKDLNKGTAE